jgi:hypothetical protein
VGKTFKVVGLPDGVELSAQKTPSFYGTGVLSSLLAAEPAIILERYERNHDFYLCIFLLREWLHLSQSKRLLKLKMIAIKQKQNKNSNWTCSRYCQRSIFNCILILLSCIESFHVHIYDILFSDVNRVRS